MANMLLTEEIIAWSNSKQVNEAQAAANMNIIDQQCDRELALLKNFDFCLYSNTLNNHLKDLDPNRLKKLLTDYYYDIYVMQFAACIANAIFNSDNDIGTNNNFSREYIKRFITHLNQIGNESAFGYALSGNLNNSSTTLSSDNIFIIKSPRNPKDVKVLIHEGFTGLAGTNRLREFIPNFAYVYSIFNCLTPNIENKEVKNWCSTDGYYYVVYESISNAETFGDYIRSDRCTAQGIINYVTQIALALDFAAQKIGFTHNDLHVGNILLRKLDQPKQIKYPYRDRGDYYIVTDAIPTFIDYGMVYMTYKNEGFGSSNPFWRDEINRTFIMADIFKLLGNILDGLKYYHLNIYNQLVDIIFYFIARPGTYNIADIAYQNLPENINQLPNDLITRPHIQIRDFHVNINNFIERLRPSIFVYPYTNKSSNLNIADFINYIINYIPIDNFYSSPINNVPMLLSNLTDEQLFAFTKMYLDTPISPPDDIFMLIKLVRNLINSNKDTELSNLTTKAKSRIDNYTHEEIVRRNQLIRRINQNLDILNFPNGYVFHYTIQNWARFINSLNNWCVVDNGSKISKVIDYLDALHTLDTTKLILTNFSNISIFKEFRKVTNVYQNVDIRANVLARIRDDINIVRSVMMPELYNRPVPDYLEQFRISSYNAWNIIYDKINYMIKLLE